MFDKEFKRLKKMMKLKKKYLFSSMYSVKSREQKYSFEFDIDTKKAIIYITYSSEQRLKHIVRFISKYIGSKSVYGRKYSIFITCYNDKIRKISDIMNYRKYIEITYRYPNIMNNIEIDRHKQAIRVFTQYDIGEYDKFVYYICSHEQFVTLSYTTELNKMIRNNTNYSEIGLRLSYLYSVCRYDKSDIASLLRRPVSVVSNYINGFLKTQAAQDSALGQLTNYYKKINMINMLYEGVKTNE